MLKPKILDGINVNDELCPKEIDNLYRIMIDLGSFQKLADSIGVTYWSLYNTMTGRTNSSLATRYKVRKRLEKYHDMFE